MSVSAFWERMTVWSLRHRGVKAELMTFDRYQMSTLKVIKKKIKDPSKRIVCIHGLGSSAAAYGSLLPLLSTYWEQVLAPSAPSHGMSPPLPKETETSNAGNRFQSRIYQAWETCLLQLSSDQPIDLLGVSLGGAVAIRFASKYPKRVSTLMLCSPAGAILDEADIDHLRKVFSMKNWGDGFRFLQTLYHRVPWWGRIIAPLVRLSLSRPEAQALITQLKPGDGLKVSELSSLDVPVLLIWGQEERVLPSSSLKKLLDHFPKDLILLQPEHFSHTPQKEYPSDLAQHLISFQEQVEHISS